MSARVLRSHERSGGISAQLCRVRCFSKERLGSARGFAAANAGGGEIGEPREDSTIYVKALRRTVLRAVSDSVYRAATPFLSRLSRRSSMSCKSWVSLSMSSQG